MAADVFNRLVIHERTGRAFTRRLCPMKRVLTYLAAAAGNRTALGALFLFVLVFTVYAPILPGSFLMDDHRLIKEDNALVNGEMSPLTFWFQTDFTLSAIGWWLQWLAWGDHPAPYHVVNIC